MSSGSSIPTFGLPLLSSPVGLNETPRASSLMLSGSPDWNYQTPLLSSFLIEIIDFSHRLAPRSELSDSYSRAPQLKLLDFLIVGLLDRNYWICWPSDFPIGIIRFSYRRVPWLELSDLLTIGLPDWNYWIFLSSGSLIGIIEFANCRAFWLKLLDFLIVGLPDRNYWTFL